MKKRGYGIKCWSNLSPEKPNWYSARALRSMPRMNTVFQKTDEQRSNANQSLFGELKLLAAVTTAIKSELCQIKKEGSALFLCLGG